MNWVFAESWLHATFIVQLLMMSSIELKALDFLSPMEFSNYDWSLRCIVCNYNYLKICVCVQIRQGM